VNVKSSPEHNIPSSFSNPLISDIATLGSGNANTSTSISSISVHPFTSVTVTIYVCNPTAGDTVIVLLISPVFHSYEIPPDAVNVATSISQIKPSSLNSALVSNTSIIASGKSYTSTITSLDAVHPFTSVTVTVYVCWPTA